MATITIKINEKTSIGRAILQLIKAHKDDVEIIDVPNATTIKAIKELESGKGKTAKSAKDLFKQLGI